MQPLLALAGRSILVWCLYRCISETRTRCEELPLLLPSLCSLCCETTQLASQQTSFTSGVPPCHGVPPLHGVFHTVPPTLFAPALRQSCDVCIKVFMESWWDISKCPSLSLWSTSAPCSVMFRGKFYGRTFTVGRCIYELGQSVVISSHCITYKNSVFFSVLQC